MNNLTTEQLIDKLTKAISFKFKEDKTAPGLTVSALKKGYYCSIVRYEGPFARNKVVVCKAKGKTLPEALNELTTTFLTAQDNPTDPIQDLRKSFILSTVFGEEN